MSQWPIAAFIEASKYVCILPRTSIPRMNRTVSGPPRHDSSTIDDILLYQSYNDVIVIE